MKNQNILVGIFVVVGLTLFSVGIFMVGDRHSAFARHVQFHTEFKDLNGLSKGSKVRVAGMDAGEVLEVGVPDSPSSRFRVQFEINEALHGLVRTNSVAVITTEGIVGGTYLLVRPGTTNAAAAAPFSTLPSQESVQMSEVLDKGLGLVNDTDATIKHLGGKLTGTLEDVNTTVGNVNDVVVGLKQGRGPAGMLLQDQQLAGQIRQAVGNVQQASAALSHASGQADSLISDVKSRQLPAKVEETLADAKSATANLNETSRQIRQTIAEVTGPDKEGVSAGVNISETLSNMNVATANMAEDTEALKRNFFFRGFFRHRGYYNLNDMQAEKYRKDRVFVSPDNYRAWLSSTELFLRDSNGKEQLSAQGRHSLDSAIIQNGESVVDRAIVIEGYSNSVDQADQLSSSRIRAILVRQYLQSHFQLSAGDLGVVSMKNAPPEGLGHSPWDGVCVVVLKGRR